MSVCTVYDRERRESRGGENKFCPQAALAARCMNNRPQAAPAHYIQKGIGRRQSPKQSRFELFKILIVERLVGLFLHEFDQIAGRASEKRAQFADQIGVDSLKFIPAIAVEVGPWDIQEAAQSIFADILFRQLFLYIQV